MSTEAFVYDAIRTPRGRNRGGSLHGTKPIDLVVGLIDELRRRNPSLDPVADDVASLGLDALMRDSEWRRGGFNHFLIGY